MEPEEVRLAVYRSFAETGRPPAAGSLDEHALHELHDERHIVLGADGEIVMAHPFSLPPRSAS